MLKAIPSFVMPLVAVLALSGCAANGEMGFDHHPLDCAEGYAHNDCLPGTAGYDKYQDIVSQGGTPPTQAQMAIEGLVNGLSAGAAARQQQQYEGVTPATIPVPQAPSKIILTGSDGQPLGTAHTFNNRTTFTGPTGEPEGTANTVGNRTTFTGSAGEPEGTASTFGNRTTFTGPTGQPDGTATTFGNRTTFTGPAGQPEGTANTVGNKTILTGPSGEPEGTANTSGN